MESQNHFLLAPWIIIIDHASKRKWGMKLASTPHHRIIRIPDGGRATWTWREGLASRQSFTPKTYVKPRTVEKLEGEDLLWSPILFRSSREPSAERRAPSDVLVQNIIFQSAGSDWCLLVPSCVVLHCSQPANNNIHHDKQMSSSAFDCRSQGSFEHCSASTRNSPNLFG